MLTVPEAARIAGRNPETIRRWIRSGRLPATRMGTQHFIERDDLEATVDPGGSLPVPESLLRFADGTLIPDPVPIVRELRDGGR